MLDKCLQAVNLWRTQIEKGNTMHLYRTHTCGALRAENIDEQVRVSGWVHRKRDHGGLLFIDLRDHYGLTQLVIEPSSPHFALAEQIRAESVIRADGKVVARDDEARNRICRPATLRCICPSWKFCRNRRPASPGFR